MNIVEFSLLALICTVYPCKSKDQAHINRFTVQRNLPTFELIAAQQYEEGRQIHVYEMRKNGCHCGYEFRFIGFPKKGVIVPPCIDEIEYEMDSYQVGDGTLNISALFTDAMRPEFSFIAYFTLWGYKIYQIDVPVQEKVHPHARE